MSLERFAFSKSEKQCRVKITKGESVDSPFVILTYSNTLGKAYE